MIQDFLSRQFVSFLITGGSAAAINFGSRILYSHWMGFSSAVFCAYLTGMISAFILAKLFVFKKSQQGLRRSAFFFSLVNAIAILQTWAISMGLAYYLLPRMGVSNFGPEIAHGVGVVVPVFTSYIGHKRWSFR